MTLHGGGFDGFNDLDRGGILGGGDNLLGSAITAQGATAGRGPDSVGIFGEGGIFGAGGAASIGFGGLKTLGSIWNSFQQFKLAKSSLKFQKDAFKTNLANSTKVYNTALEGRIRARFATEGRSGEADAKIAANRL